MNQEHYIKIRPYAYHLTARGNLDVIRTSRRLLSAQALASDDHERAALTEKRQEGVRFAKAFIRDQKPLHRSNIELAEGFAFDQLLDLLNAQIFFWPGTNEGPIRAGLNHYERYKGESPIVLRISTRSLVDANQRRVPRLCQYNSGAPRCSGGNKSPRGPETFRPAEDFLGTASQVVAQTFELAVDLPDSTMIGPSPQGPWTPLFGTPSPSTMETGTEAWFRPTRRSRISATGLAPLRDRHTLCRGPFTTARRFPH